MKYVIINILLFTAAYYAHAQKSTKDNYTGEWTDNNSWVGGTAPNTSNLPSPDDEDYTINGYINVGSYEANQNLTFRTNRESYDFTINDTLIVYGNVNFGNKAMNLIINSGGFLIILGDLNMDNRIDIAADGNIIVSGNFSKNGSQGSFTGSGEFYAGSYSGNAGELIPDSQENNSGIDLDDDFPDIYDFVHEDGYGTLPVRVVYFRAEAEKNTVKLSWATSSEVNFDCFTVERSADGFDFTNIGQVHPTITTADVFKEYSFIDEMPLPGINYYRLKATDYDGAAEYHGITAAKANEQTIRLNIYPNPSDGYRAGMIYSGTDETMFKIVSFTGETIDQGRLVPGLNDITFQQKLSPGIYFIYTVGFNLDKPQKLIVR